MAQPVTRILGIAPYDGMRASLEKVAMNYPNVQFDAFTGDMEDGAEIVKRYGTEDYDAIISRGGTAQLIQTLTEIPVISIRLSVYDVLRVIKMVENYSSLYAVVGFPSITEPAHILCDLLGYELDIITVHSAGEAETALGRLRQGGYKMVVSDVVTHTLALQNGMTAFLITSGMESLHTAFDEAIRISGYLQELRREVHFLRRIARERESNTVIMDAKGELCYSVKERPEERQLELLRKRIPEIPPGSQIKFYQNERGSLYQISARAPRIAQERYYLFRYAVTRIPLRSDRPGIRALSSMEVTHLSAGSFYSISGAMGALEDQLNAVAGSYQPLMLLGEAGTAKEQIARAVYLRSPRTRSPFVTVDCTVAGDREWDFLFDHYASPLNEREGTVFFRHAEEMPDHSCSRLLAITMETNLVKRIRLIFSYDWTEEEAMPDKARRIISRLGCVCLQLPALRSRSDEISSLAGLCLNVINQELGKQLVGFEPRAMEQLRSYHWPNNFTQFKKVLLALATITDTSYIRSGDVAEVLARERALHHPKAARQPAGTGQPGRTLEQITLEAVRQAVDACGGNQTMAAKRLGISRSTLWRYLKG